MDRIETGGNRLALNAARKIAPVRPGLVVFIPTKITSGMNSTVRVIFESARDNNSQPRLRNRAPATFFQARSEQMKRLNRVANCALS